MTAFVGWTPPVGAVVNPPVHPETIVHTIYSDRHEDECVRASELNWSAVGDGPCVVAYAVVQEYVETKVAREWWLVDECEAYDSEQEAINSLAGLMRPKPIIHVREVLPADPSREVVAWAVVRGGKIEALDIDAGGAALNFAADHGGTVVKLTGVKP